MIDAKFDGLDGYFNSSLVARRSLLVFAGLLVGAESRQLGKAD